MPLKWGSKCQKNLELVQEALSHYPLLIYPNLSENFHLYTDALKHTWFGALT